MMFHVLLRQKLFIPLEGLDSELFFIHPRSLFLYSRTNPSLYIHSNISKGLIKAEWSFGKQESWATTKVHLSTTMHGVDIVKDVNIEGAELEKCRKQWHYVVIKTP